MIPSINIRPMRIEDIPQCLACARDGWDRSTAAHAFDELNAGLSTAIARPTFYVAEGEDSKIAGMAGYATAWLDCDTFALCWVCVRLGQRNQGIGRMLVDRCLQDLLLIARSVVLTTDVPEFYSSNWNFRIIDKCPNGSMFMSLHLEDAGIAKRYV